MTLLQNKSRWAFECIIYAILFLMADMYYLHITNQNAALGIASNNLLFAMTSLLGLTLMRAKVEFFKRYYNEKQQEKIADLFGYTALIALFGGLLFFTVFWIGTPPLWTSDLLIQTITFGAIGCVAITPKKGNYTLAISMIFPLMTTVVYLCYRF